MKLNILFAVLMVALLGTSCSNKTAQNNEVTSEEVARLIQSQNFIFKATTALPARGRSLQLTSDYTFTVKKDSLISFLPYFGRAYTAPIDRRGGGIEFTSTDFEYNLNQKNNGGFEIQITPKDTRDVQRIFMTVSPSGYGNLNVTSQNRQQIAFNGYIQREVRLGSR